MNGKAAKAIRRKAKQAAKEDNLPEKWLYKETKKRYRRKAVIDS